MKVKNRSANVVVYTIADLNVRRRFSPSEIKDLDKIEIEKLLYQPGGRELFINNLQVSAEDMRSLGFGDQEPEYFYSAEDIQKLMVSGRYEEFLDFLDFAPEGGLSIVKDLAVKLPLSDMNKAEAIKKATGFDVMKAIANDQAVKKDLNGVQDTTTETRTRRIAIKEEPKYKVISE